MNLKPFRKERTAIERAADAVRARAEDIMTLTVATVIIAVCALIVACVALGKAKHG